MVSLSISKERRHMERLLAGDLNTQHVDRLLLFARDRRDGRDTVREVGDFIAHISERYKGITTDACRDFFLTAMFKIKNLEKETNLSDLPTIFPKFLTTMAKLISEEILREHTGLHRRQVVKLLPDLTARMHKKENGNIALTSITEKELKVIKCLCSFIVAKPVFSAEKLISDLEAILRSNAILKKEESRQFKSLSNFIVLHCLTCMHNVIVKLNDQETALLRIGIGSDGMLSIDASGPPMENNVSIITNMITTEVMARDHCTERLLVHRELWQQPVYVNNQQKIDIL